MEVNPVRKEDPLYIENDEDNINYIPIQNDWASNCFWGMLHSKLMLLEFDDRLRVVVSSSNLENSNWYFMSQVIWFQDFFPKQGIKENKASDFEQYLNDFVNRLKPKVNTKVFRQEINISRYDFSTAIVKLVGSVHGRWKGHGL